MKTQHDQAKGRSAISANRFIILMLGALVTITPFSIDMYLPAFSQMAKDFGTTPAKISLSVTSYFIGMAIGQMIYGPLLDRYGRKKPLYYGLGIYLLTSVGCLLSGSVNMLIALRFLQALGGCVAWVAAMAMVRDFFSNEDMPKVLSLLILLIGSSPLLAPTVGGFITDSLGWQWVFIVLICMVVVDMIVTALFLPQKYQPDPSVSLKMKPMLATFYSILKHPQFAVYTWSGAFGFASMFIYVAGSPVIFMEIFHVSPKLYGGIFALLSVGFIGSGQVNILLLKKYTSAQIYRVAIYVQVLTSAIFLYGTLQGWYGLVATIVLFFIILSCLGFMYPNSNALALAPFKKNAGSASALIGCLQIGLAGLASGSVGLFNAKNSTPIVVMLFVTAVIGLLILVAGKRKAELTTGMA
nr:drug resistance transporter, Bcr/CflA subfamily [uncultured bacterium]